MLTRVGLFFLSCWFMLPPLHFAAAQQPGDAPPAEIRKPLGQERDALERAMRGKDLDAVQKHVARVRELLGPLAGVPESPEQYVASKTATPDLDTVVALWEQVLRERLPKQGSRDPEAAENRIEMRGPAYIAIVCLAAATTDLPGKEVYIARAREELDYLVARQGEDGMFPYPVAPAHGVPENVRREIAVRAVQHRDKIKNGLLYWNEPGMQFDTGCAGVALCEGYRLTREETYLAAAERAGQWAMACPLAANWNYNAFSVWLLANLYHVSGKDEYLLAALEKTKYGVLPGLMETGRWVDQHNAKQSYHFIMCRALSDLEHFMPARHPERQTIAEKLALAVDSRARDIVKDGVSNTESALWGLAAVCRQQGDAGPRKDALNAVVNAVLERPNGSSLLLPIYLRYRLASGAES